MTSSTVGKDGRAALVTKPSSDVTEGGRTGWSAREVVARRMHEYDGQGKWSDEQSYWLELADEAILAIRSETRPIQTDTIADLVNNLLALDQSMPVFGVYFIELDGRKEARARGISLSRERIEGGRVVSDDASLPYSLAIWTSTDERSIPASGAEGMKARETELSTDTSVAEKCPLSTSSLPQITSIDARVKELEEALAPFAKAAREFSFAIAPDGIDDGLTVTAQVHVRPEREAILSTADFSKAARILSQGSPEQ